MWVDRMDNITQSERRKLSALVLMSLLPSDNSVIQDKFCWIINISVKALHDVMTEDPEMATFKDCMLMSHSKEPKLTDDEEPPTEQDKRRKLIVVVLPCVPFCSPGCVGSWIPPLFFVESSCSLHRNHEHRHWDYSTGSPRIITVVHWGPCVTHYLSL
ncbi:importin-11-like [Carassius carassius]|uniref:importin-11-like n=1 Tax=Carassius carassius TaxID=217509 RepID=UPI0028694D58|nr:importin-11-like [Carassius carassius]